MPDDITCRCTTSLRPRRRARKARRRTCLMARFGHRKRRGGCTRPALASDGREQGGRSRRRFWSELEIISVSVKKHSLATFRNVSCWACCFYSRSTRRGGVLSIVTAFIGTDRTTNRGPGGRAECAGHILAPGMPSGLGFHQSALKEGRSAQGSQGCPRDFCRFRRRYRQHAVNRASILVNGRATPRSVVQHRVREEHEPHDRYATSPRAIAGNARKARRRDRCDRCLSFNISSSSRRLYDPLPSFPQVRFKADFAALGQQLEDRDVLVHRVYTVGHSACPSTRVVRRWTTSKCDRSEMP